MRGRWWRPKPRQTSREPYEAIWRQRRVASPRVEQRCAAGCHRDDLYWVVAGAALEGSMICRACGTVYRMEEL